MANTKQQYAAEMMLLGDTWFLYLYNNDIGGRLVNVRNIISIVPNFKLGGSMIFLQDSEKAVSVDQPPEEIAEHLRRTK